MEKFYNLLKYEFISLCKSRWVWIYLIAFNVFLFALRYFSNDLQQLYVSTLNSVLLFHSVSLLLFATLSWQNNSDFISLILTQPVSRRSVFTARVLAFYTCIILSTAISLAIQMFSSLSLQDFFAVMAAQASVEIIFSGLGFFLAIQIQDRLKAMAMAAGLILFFCLILDGISLWIIINYSSYPLEKVLLFLGAINPINLIKYQHLVDERNVLWIGYSGIILTRIWQSTLVKLISLAALFLWIIGPMTIAWNSFRKKDF